MADRGLVSIFRVADPGLLTFFARSKKVSKERPPLVHRHVVVALCYSTNQAAVELAVDMRKHVLNVRQLRQSSPNSLVRLCYSAALKGPVNKRHLN